MSSLDREGMFRARAIEWTVEPSKSTQSQGIAVRMMIEAEKVGGDDRVEGEGDNAVEIKDGWMPYPTGWDVYGRWYVIGQNGQVNQTALDQMHQVLGWNGDFKSIAETPVIDIECVVQVKGEPYEGQIKYKASWVYPKDHDGGSLRKADPANIRVLNDRYGSQIKAMLGGGKPLPAGRPAPIGAKVVAGPADSAAQASNGAAHGTDGAATLPAAGAVPNSPAAPPKARSRPASRSASVTPAAAPADANAGFSAEDVPF